MISGSINTTSYRSPETTSGQSIKSKKDAINRTLTRINNCYFGISSELIKPSARGSHQESFQTVMTALVRNVNSKMNQSALPLGDSQKVTLSNLLTELQSHINEIGKDTQQRAVSSRVSQDIGAVITALRTPPRPVSFPLSSPAPRPVLRHQQSAQKPILKHGTSLPKPTQNTHQDKYRELNMALDIAVLKLSHSQDSPSKETVAPILDLIADSVGSDRPIQDIFRPLNTTKLDAVKPHFRTWIADNLLKPTSDNRNLATRRITEFYNQREASALDKLLPEAPGPKGRDYSPEELKSNLINKNPKELDTFLRLLNLNNRVEQYRPEIQRRFEGIQRLIQNTHTTPKERSNYMALANVIQPHLTQKG